MHEENRRSHNAWEKRKAVDMIDPSKFQLTMHQKTNSETVGSSCVTAGSSSCVSRINGCVFHFPPAPTAVNGVLGTHLDARGLPALGRETSCTRGAEFARTSWPPPLHSVLRISGGGGADGHWCLAEGNVHTGTDSLS
jgi:hypothetical protein